MDDFPAFLKNTKNRIDAGSEYAAGIEGYVFDGADGSQVALWTCRRDGAGTEHTHPYDEYIVVVQGQYTVSLKGKQIILKPGEEYLIPSGVPHFGARIAGTRTIHAFGGKRAKRETDVG